MISFDEAYRIWKSKTNLHYGSYCIHGIIEGGPGFIGFDHCDLNSNYPISLCLSCQFYQLDEKKAKKAFYSDCISGYMQSSICDLLHISNIEEIDEIRQYYQQLSIRENDRKERILLMRQVRDRRRKICQDQK